jgi:hypothetical protein
VIIILKKYLIKSKKKIENCVRENINTEVAYVLCTAKWSTQLALRYDQEYIKFIEFDAILKQWMWTGGYISCKTADKRRAFMVIRLT